jgi:hypothetical protein
MPTCGFIRVQPDGMKEKDAGNRQRYDPVSKRMITTHPEIPTISKVSLRISQPVFVDADGIFKSDYIVTFQGYTGCLNYGNEVTCSIYDQTGAQTATVIAKVTNGINTVVLNGPYTPGGYVYYATIKYGLSRFNSSQTQLLPDLPIISNGMINLSSTNFYETVPVGGEGFSFNDAFYWRGTLNINFLSYDSSSSPASYRIVNITDPAAPYEVASGNLTLSYGQNTIPIMPEFVKIASSRPSDRGSVPYNPAETLSANITYNSVDFPLQGIVFSPALIRDVVLSLTESYWVGSQLYAGYRLRYYFADGTQSWFPGGNSSVYRGIPLIRFFMVNPDGSTTQISSYADPQPATAYNAVGNYVTLNPIPFQLTSSVPMPYYGTVEYDDQSFTNSVSFASSPVNSLVPEILSSPVIASVSNIRTQALSPYGLIGNFTVTLNYQPRNGQGASLAFTIKSTTNSVTPTTRTAVVVVGLNTLQFNDIPVVAGDNYTVSVLTGSVSSTSVPIICPNYSNLVFTSVPSNVTTFAGGVVVDNFSITIGWNNVISGYTGQTITIGTVGLSSDSSITYTPNVPGNATITFNMNPDSLAGNSIEYNLANSVREAGGFPDFKFKLTDSSLTQASVLSSVIRSG